MSVFHASGLVPLKHLVRAIVSLNWIQANNWWQIFSIKEQLNLAFKYLLNFDVVVGNQAIVAPEVIFQPMKILNAQASLARWLLLNGRFWRKLLLSYLFKALDEYYLTLFVLEASGRQHPDHDRELYNRLKARKDAFLNKIVSDMEKLFRPEPPTRSDVIYYDEKYKLMVEDESDLPQLYNARSIEKWCQAGFYDLEKGRKSDALRTFRTAIRISPFNPIPHFGMSQLYWSWGQKYEAIEECEHAIQLNPEFLVGHYTLGYMHLAELNLDRAIESFEKSLELNPEFLPPKIGLARVMLLKEQPHEALSLLENTLQNLPDNKQLSILISWLKIALSDANVEEKEDEYLLLLLAYLPEITDTLIYTKIPDLEIAVRDAKIIVAYLLNEDVDDFELIDMFIAIAQLNIAEGRLDKALSLYQKAIRLKPNFYDVYILLGNTYQLANLPTPSLEIYYKAIALSPKAIDAYNGIAKISLIIGKIDNAIEACFQTLEIDPYCIEANILLTLCYQKLGLGDKFEEQLDLISNLENLGIFEKSRIEALKGNEELVFQMLETAFNQDLLHTSYVLTDPCFANIIEHPNMRTLLEKYKYNLVTT